MNATRWVGGGVALTIAVASPVFGQQFRLELDSRFQSVAYRGLRRDSVLASDAVTSEHGGPATRDGFALRCWPGVAYCYFFRPGDPLRANPWVTTARGTLWGLGFRGLSFHVAASGAVDLGSSNLWPGSTPALRLIEGYARLARTSWELRAGRQYVASRFGLQGLDGLRADLEVARVGLELTGYTGWSLARGSSLPIGSPALNPLDEFRPRRRQLLSGLQLGLRRGPLVVRSAYQREFDPGPRHLAGERVGADLLAELPPSFSLSLGGDYDLAMGWWGNAEAVLGFRRGDRLVGDLGARRYRPYFELWTIWPAFTSVPYNSVFGNLSLKVAGPLTVGVRGETYRYAPTGVTTGLSVETLHRGWRWILGGTYQDHPLAASASYFLELGPGAGAGGLEGSLKYRATEKLTLALHGSYLRRPLELRFNESTLRTLEAQADYRVSGRLLLGAELARYEENRDRPDAAAVTWDQFRIATRVSVALRRATEGAGLPAAVLRMPRRSSGQ